MMKARHGRIINITSVVGAMGNAGQANYAAAKAGIMGFTRALARELGPRGITVNAIAPGFIDTDMTRGLPDKDRDQMVAQIPLKRLGSVDDIAGAAVFLAGPSAGLHHGRHVARERWNVHVLMRSTVKRIRPKLLICRHFEIVAQAPKMCPCNLNLFQ